MTEGRDTKFTEREKNIIGGEFAIHRIEDMAIVPKEGRDLFASGRTALYAILQDAHQEKGCREILLPDYLCDSVTRTIQDYGLSYDFYHIHNDLYPDWESVEERLIPNCAILLINYFGILNLSRFVERLREQTSSPIIIMDDVQNYYGFAQIDHDYAFTSHRKWFPVPDGAMVSKRGGEIPAPTGKNSFAPYKYAGNMLKEMKEVPDEVCLSLLERGERILEQDYMVACSDYGRLGYARLNVRDIKRKRKQNAEYLHRELTRMGISHAYQEETVPLFIPVFLANRDVVRKQMLQENIFTPVHWPYISVKLSGPGNELYDRELSLICDQRYDLNDMERQIGVLCR